MIISDEHRFFFVHIPKCAGSTVRSQIAHVDSYGGRFSQIGDHPTWGRLDYPHLPLHVLADACPGEFAKLRCYDSVALLRDPYERFLSSIMQRLRFWKNASVRDFTQKTVTDEAVRVISHLEATPGYVGLTYTHFIRQSDYISLDGERIVGTLFTIGQLRQFSDFLRQRVGFGLDLRTRENVSAVPSYPWLRQAAIALRPAYQALLSPAMKNRMRNRMQRYGLYRDASQMFLEDLLGNDFITGFIADYYRDDIARFAELRGDG